MHEVVAHFVVADCVVRINLGAVLDVLQQDVLQSLAGDGRDNLSAYLDEDYGQGFPARQCFRHAFRPASQGAVCGLCACSS